jgi:negative regulator of flagellin synthesis FlgM
VVTTRIKGPEGGAIEGTGRSRTIGRAQPATRTPSASNPSSDSVETVHITSAAHQMLALQQQIGETPDIDTARVEQLRADINQNRYQIDAGRIADRLLQLEGDLQASTKKTDSGP